MAKRTALEDKYRASAEQSEDVVELKIKTARAGPQTTQPLQAIHDAHAAVLATEAKIKAVHEAENVHKVNTTSK